MHVSYAELQRAASDALRGLKLPFGQAEDLVEGFLLTQAAYGSGYALLKEADALRPARSWEAPGLGKGSKTTIDLKQQPLLIFAPRLSDYIRIQEPVFTLRVLNLQGGYSIVPYICSSAARHGGTFAASTPCRDSDGIHVIARCNGVTAIVYALESRLRWESILGSAVRRGDTATIDDPSALEIVAFGNGDTLDIFPSAKMVDMASARLLAIREGMEVARADDDFFRALTARIRIPSSERSRAQAG